MSVDCDTAEVDDAREDWQRMLLQDGWAKGWVAFFSGLDAGSVCSPPPLAPMVLQMANALVAKEPSWRHAPLVGPNWWRHVHVEYPSQLPSHVRFTKLRMSPFRQETLVALSQTPNAVREIRLVHGRVLDLTPLNHLPKLRRVQSDYTHFQVDSVAPFARLSHLSLSHVKGSFLLGAALQSSTSLVSIEVEGPVINTSHLIGLERIPTLTQLSVSGCVNVCSVGFLSTSSSLERLDASFTQVTAKGVVGLERIPTLRYVSLAHCEVLFDVSCLGESTSIEELDVGELALSMTTFPRLFGDGCNPLGRVMKTLRLDGVLLGDADIYTSVAQTAIVQLEMRGCGAVIAPVSGLALSTTLTALHADGTEILDIHMDGIGASKSLRYLNLSRNYSLHHVRHLRSNTSLVEIDLHGSTLKAVDGLEGIPTLTRLNLAHCYLLEDVTVLSASRSIERLDLGSTKLTCAGIAGIERLATLTWLSLERCAKIDTVSVLLQPPSRLQQLNIRWTGVVGAELVRASTCTTTRVLI